MSVNPRHNAIVDRLHRDGSVDVNGLASDLDISAITIRRDLDQLARAGVLRRVRGGAVNLLMRGEGLPFPLRDLDDHVVKTRMAAAAEQLIQDGEAVAIDSGTTGAAAAGALSGRRIIAMPFSVQAIGRLASSVTVTLILPGGNVRPDEGSIVGPLAQVATDSLRFDTAIVTCCGIDPDAGIMAHDLQDAATKRGIMNAARRKILIAEGAKFSRSAFATVAPLTDIDVLITDDTAPADTLDELIAQGIHVIVVASSPATQR
jgi:DeoR/GlpR family transcriptional regulator of sugar metabolism